MNEEPSLHDLVAGGATFLEILDYLVNRSSPRTLSPFEFLKTFQEELGISFVESRNMLEYFDPSMTPIVDTELINERGHMLLQGRHRP